MTDNARPPVSRVDRDEVFLEYTKSICPVCKVVIDAEVNLRDGRIVLSKRCREHGKFDALISSDAEGYLDAVRYNKPGTLPLATQTEVVDGCPLDCGMCPDHKQQACLGILEVNSNCNLDCPICFADSGHQPDHFVLSLDQIEVALDSFVKAEGEPEVVMFSGGEPTIHPHILEAMEMAYAKGVKNVTLHTNGIRLAHDRKFVRELAAMQPKPPGIYLQFDGLKEETHLAIRARDLRTAKQTALDNCAEAGLIVTLAAAIEKDVNADEVGDIVRFGIGHPAVRAVAFQPVTHSGRHLKFDPMERLCNADVVAGLVEQCPDWFKKSDFFPVPCCFPTCRSITYLLVEGDNVRSGCGLLGESYHPGGVILPSTTSFRPPSPGEHRRWPFGSRPGREEAQRKLHLHHGAPSHTADTMRASSPLPSSPAVAPHRPVRPLRAALHHRHPLRPPGPHHHRPPRRRGPHRPAPARLLRHHVVRVVLPRLGHRPPLRTHRHPGVHRGREQLRAVHRRRHRREGHRSIRPIRDEIDRRVQDLLSELLPPQPRGHGLVFGTDVAPPEPGEPDDGGGDEQAATEVVDGGDPGSVSEEPTGADTGQARGLPYHVVEGEDPPSPVVRHDRLQCRVEGDVAGGGPDPVGGQGDEGTGEGGERGEAEIDQTSQQVGTEEVGGMANVAGEAAEDERPSGGSDADGGEKDTEAGCAEVKVVFSEHDEQRRGGTG